MPGDVEAWSVERAQAAIALLNRLIKLRLGHGGIKKLESALGKHERWWQKQKSKKSIVLSDLFAVLAVLGMSLKEFEAELDREPGDFGGDSHKLPGKAAGDDHTPTLCKLAMDRAESAIVAVEGLSRRELDKLDEARFDEPIAVLRRLPEYLGWASCRREISELLSIGGGCYRILYKPAEAMACHDLALALTASPLARIDPPVLARIAPPPS